MIFVAPATPPLTIVPTPSTTRVDAPELLLPMSVVSGLAVLPNVRLPMLTAKDRFTFRALVGPLRMNAPSFASCGYPRDVPPVQLAASVQLKLPPLVGTHVYESAACTM